MKNFQRFLVSMVLLMLWTSPAYAQLSILPKSPDDPALCKKLLDEYELYGAIPSVKFQKATADKEKADNDYAAAKGATSAAADPVTVGDCASGTPVNPKACEDLKAAIGKENSAKGSADKANAEYESLKASNDKSSPDDRGQLLGCAIRTGRVSLQMIPYFITYFSNYLLSLVGIISVLFIVIGGYQYIRGGLTENKEKGKKTIEHALAGMVVAILAWVIINLVMGVLTS